MFGQLTFNATDDLNVISSHVQPSINIMADVPAMSEPEGEATTIVIPFALATGINSDSGLNAASARTLGLMRPVSVRSLDARTAPISVSPMYVSGLISPG